MKNKSLVIFLLFVVCFYSLSAVSSEVVNGTGFYTWKCQITPDQDNTYSIQGADIDGNGVGDIIVGNDGINKVYLNQGFNSSTSCINWKTCTITSDNYNTSSIVVADVDGDGKLDVIAANRNGPNQIYINGGVNPSTGCITWYGSNITNQNYDSHQVIVYDMDLDNDLDIVVANYGQVNKIYLNNGYNSLTHSFNWADYNVTSDRYNTNTIAVGKIDNDPWPDIVVGESTYQVNYVYYNDSGVTWSNTWTQCVYTNYPTGYEYETIKVLIADMGTSWTNMAPDGKLDILVAEEPPRGAPGSAKQERFSIYYQNSNCSWTMYEPFSNILHKPSELLINDIDSDGDNRDIVIGHDDHKNEYYLEPIYKKVDIDTAQYRTYSLAMADINDDGCLEFLVGNIIPGPGGSGGLVGNGENIYYSISSATCNGRPWANPDAYTVCSGACINAYVLLNDMDPEGSPLTITDANVTDPTKGYTVNYGTYIRYCANSGQSGTDTFTYRVSDGSKSDTAIVTITISPSPIAVPDSATTCGTTPVNINVLTNDLNKTGATATLLGTPVNGGVTEPTEGNFVFTPTTNGVSGYFDYNLSNGICWSQARVTITSNIKPDAVADTASTCSTTCVNVSVLDNDKNVSGVTLKLVGTPVNGTPTIISGNRVKFCPSITGGTGSFDYNITNGYCWDTATVTVVVTGAPVADDESTSTCSNVCVNVSVLDGYTNVGSSPTLAIDYQPASGTAAVSGSKINYCPDGTAGTFDFNYTVTNTQTGCKDTAKVTVVVTGAPVADDDTDSVCAGACVNVSVLDGDTYSLPVTLTIVDQPLTGGGSATPSSNKIYYCAPSSPGTYDFNYTVTQGTCTSNKGKVTVTVNPKPDAVDNTNIAVCNSKCVNVSVLGNDTYDPQDYVLLVVSDTNGTATVTTAGNEIKFCPSITSGTGTFVYNVSNGDCWDTGTVYVDIINCDLVATDDSYTTTLNTCKDLNVTLNDYDPEYPSDPTKLWIIDANVTDPLYGNASWIDGYTIRYCPDANWCGTDTFKYRIQDVNGSTADANVTITVPCPPIDAIDDYNTTNMFTCVDFNITDNDDGSGFKVQIVPGSLTLPTFGNVSMLDPNGTIRFCPEGSCGTATFDYNATNGFSTDRATVTVEVPCPKPECPVAVDDYNRTEMNTCVILSIMSNDYDPNGDPIRVTYIEDPPHGVYNPIDFANGIIQYCPDGNWCGTDYFEYTITDGRCEKTATVRIDVMCQKEKVPAILLYPLVDIERLTISKEPVVLDENIDSLLNTGVNVVLDGKVISVFEIVPGTQSLIAQVENRGFVTQAGVMIRFEGLPNGVTYKLEPPSQKIKAHNIGTYVVTMTAPADVPEGIYPVKAIAYTRSGTLDEVELRVVIS